MKQLDKILDVKETMLGGKSHYVKNASLFYKYAPDVGIETTSTIQTLKVSSEVETKEPLLH